ncbi:MAG: peptide synthase, partial [Desulfobulbus sp.]
MDNQNIAAVLEKVAAQRSGATALVQKIRGRYRRFTFSDLARERRDVSTRLRGAGIGRGDRVMLMVRPSMEFITLTFALFSIGAVVILIDPGMGYRN